MPHLDKSNSIVVEINFPFDGINRRIGGAFGKTETGEIVVLHRGKIGGGREGIGKQLFFNHFRGDLVMANDDDQTNTFCLIGTLSSPYFGKQVADFIAEVD